MDTTARETLARARSITAEVATRCGLLANETIDAMPSGPYAGQHVPLIDWDIHRVAVIILDHPDGWDDPAASVPVGHWAIMGDAEPVSIPGLSIDSPIWQVLAWLTPWLPSEHRPDVEGCRRAEVAQGRAGGPLTPEQRVAITRANAAARRIARVGGTACPEALMTACDPTAAPEAVRHALADLDAEVAQYTHL